MADWLTRTLETVAELIQLGLDKIEQRQATMASKQYANAPVANRWYTAWREQNGLPPEPALIPVETPQQPTKVGQTALNDKEMDTLLASFYGAKAVKTVVVKNKVSKPTPASTAKQRLLNNLALPLDNTALVTAAQNNTIDAITSDINTQSKAYISRIAAVVKGYDASEAVISSAKTSSISVSAMATIAAMPVLDKPVSATNQISPSKPFGTLMEASADMAPNPFAYMVAKNQFLSDRINRLANQYFEDSAQDEVV